MHYQEWMSIHLKVALPSPSVSNIIIMAEDLTSLQGYRKLHLLHKLLNDTVFTYSRGIRDLPLPPTTGPDDMLDEPEPLPPGLSETRSTRKRPVIHARQAIPPTHKADSWGKILLLATSHHESIPMPCCDCMDHSV